MKAAWWKFEGSETELTAFDLRIESLAGIENQKEF
jgi:hypothetical protein